MEAIDLGAQMRGDPLFRYWHHDAGFGGASPIQARFHRRQDRKRGCIWFNQAGKSRGGAAEAWAHALGSHPWREVPEAPNEGWILASDLKSGWPTLSRKLREVEPPGAVDEKCRFDESRGYMYLGQQVLKLANGSVMRGKGSDQQPIALESGTIHWAWVDEPPKEPHYNALLQRLSVHVGPLWLTLTPIGRPCRWLQLRIEGDPESQVPEELEAEEPGWWVHYASLSQSNAPHRTKESIREQKASTSRFDKAQRLEAKWEGFVAGRWLAAFHEGHVFYDEETEVPRPTAVGLFWDHGERPGSQVCYLAVYDGWRAWVLGEYVNEGGQVGPDIHVKEACDLLASWSLRPTDVTVAFGDVNSGGWSAGGQSANDMLERAFARRLGLVRPPFRIQQPHKPSGAVRIRAELMNNGLISDRIRIHSSCRALQQTCRYWEGKDDDLKHAFDAVSYGLQEWLSDLGEISGVGKYQIDI